MSSHDLVKLYCDNKVTINMTHNSVHHVKTKHVEIDYHCIKEKTEDRLICITNIPSKQ